MAAEAVPEREANEYEFDLSKYTQRLPDAYLECREERRHLYANTYRHLRKQRVYEEKGVCQRCGLVRLRLIGDTNSAAPGAILERHLGHYPKHYIAKGSGRLDASDMATIRLEKMKRKTREVKSVDIPEEE